MSMSTYSLPITFEQLIAIVNQLPESDIVRLTQSIEEKFLGDKLKMLLSEFQTNELSMKDINAEVEKVREGIHRKKIG